MADPVFGKIKQESTRDKVVTAIKDAILGGRLKTGERITETQLADEFAVSRAVIREALQQLAHEGLVEQNSYKGTRVVQLTLEQVDEIIGLRVLLESEAVRAAKRRITEADKKQLRALVARLEAARKNPKLYADLDLILHEKIWELSGNQTLRKLLTQATVPLFAMGTIVRYSPLFADEGSPAADSLGEHSSLVEAICEGTAGEAARAMQAHITQNSKYTREHFERFYAQERADENMKRPRARRSAA